ncbi:MAG: alpha/beta hydrolase [Candidatus Omnitrophica bacterium]|nr:alpha/beta hydrolase [Candidatus Omnitrophota bacterium]
MKRLMPAAFMILAFLAIRAALAISEEIESGTLRTADGVEIAYDRYKNGSDTCVIVCPGYYNSKENRWMRKTVRLLTPTYDVLIFDFRGHGESGGKFTWSLKEPMDLEAAIDYALSKGYKHLGIVAYSMGAEAAINVAAKQGGIESMVLISCPSRFDNINFHFWEPGMLADLFDNIACGWEGKGARAGSILLKKNDPIDTIGEVKNTSILFVHGDNDWIIKDCHSKKLYDAFHGNKKLEIIKGGLHAERLVQRDPDRMKKLLTDWFLTTLK